MQLTRLRTFDSDALAHSRGVAAGVRGACPSSFTPMASGDGWLVRLRTSARALSSATLRQLAQLAFVHGNGIIELTRRANLQLRGLQLERIAELRSELIALGLVDASPQREARPALLVDPVAALEPHSGVCELACLLDAALVESAADGGKLSAKLGIVLDAGSGSVSQVDADIRIVACSANARAQVFVNTFDAEHLLVECERAATVAILRKLLNELAECPTPAAIGGTRMRDLVTLRGLAALESLCTTAVAPSSSDARDSLGMSARAPELLAARAVMSSSPVAAAPSRAPESLDASANAASPSNATESRGTNPVVWALSDAFGLLGSSDVAAAPIGAPDALEASAVEASRLRASDSHGASEAAAPFDACDSLDTSAVAAALTDARNLLGVSTVAAAPFDARDSLGVGAVAAVPADAPETLGAGAAEPFAAIGFHGRWFGVGLPFGSGSREQWLAIAELAERFGDGAVRFTPAREVMITGVRSERAGELANAARALGLIVEASDLRRRIVACSGAPLCSSAYGETRALASRLAVQASPLLAAGATLHVSGCEKGCASRAFAELNVVLASGGLARIAQNADIIAASATTPVPLAVVSERLAELATQLKKQVS